MPKVNLRRGAAPAIILYTFARDREAFMHSEGIAALLEAASAACEAGDHDEALELWRQYRQQRPADAEGYLKAAVALRRAGRFDAADNLLRQGLALCVNSLPLAIDYALVAHYQSNWNEALTRWKAMAHSYPKHSAGIIGIGRVLIKLNRLAEAEEQLAVGISAFPEDLHVAATYAQVATAQRHWKDALARWDKVLALKSDSESALTERKIALSHIIASETAISPFVDVVRSSSVTSNVGLDRIGRTTIGRVVLQYESLGDNSEFGFVQRHFKAEPVGLLRWTYCVADSVINLLEQQFSGFGNSKNLTLFRTSWKEYMVREKLYGITFPTFSTDDITDESAFLRDQNTRLSRMAEQLHSDLTHSSKRFLFNISHSTSDAQIQRLHSLVQQYSERNRLVCVSVARDATECGTVVNLGNGLIYGKLSRRSLIGTRWDIPFDEWRSILESAATF